ncbi:MAG: outer membrane protein assembly factor BamA [Desulfoprunum sp.]|uniref:outer membrane protein assembly factor BamA n=1 Tax=Desulfoprunum sp. TaxID=2020866 RepID=UPI00052D5831|nr:membrane protein [Desulfobulbus sp. Tol-SR]
MDHTGKTLSPVRHLHMFRLLQLLLFALATVIFAGPAISAEQNTAFLPLKINSQQDVDKLAIQADTFLEEALVSNGQTMLSRARVESMADYSKAWPPAVPQMQKIAETTGFDNVAAGSLTYVGKQISIDIKVFDLLTPNAPRYYFKDGLTVETLRDGIAAVIGDILLYSGKDLRIATITPQGNKRIDSGAILRKIKSKVGDIYSPSTLREDLKSIYSMGYFNDVQIDVSETEKGKNIVFKLVEKPVIASLVYEGIDELKEEDVKSAANIKEHFILNPAKINTAVEAIRELYKSKGYYNTKVKTETTFPSDEGAVVRIIIDEGSKIYIKKIDFEGNTTFDDDELADEIETSEKGWFSWLTASGTLKMDEVKQDVGRIVAFYNNHGFLEARISEPTIRQEDEWLYLTFMVEEGPRFKVGTIDIAGDLITGKDDLLNLLSIRKEEFLSRQVMRDDILKITDYYAERGYAFATVRPDIKKSASGGRLDVVFKIEKGELVYIDRISIKGNTRTRDNVIRRELKVSEGGIFDSKALRESTQALQRLEYFEEVNITPEPSLDPTRMNIVIDVKEKSTGTFSIGAGYSSVDNLIFMGEISENNFLGRGDRLSLATNIGGSSSRYNLGYTNPRLNDSELSWGADLFDTEREYDDYTKDSQGGDIRVGYPVWEKWRMIGMYSFTDTDLTDVSDNASYVIRNSVDLHVTSAVKVSLVRDSRDRILNASKGSYHLLSAEYAGGPFAGDAEFTKLEGSTSWYFPLFWKTVFHFKGSAGQVFENENDKLPVYERFYLGGINTVRGFDYGDISPIDPVTGERIGGDKMWYTNWEILFPLAESQGVQGLVFFDAGQVLDDDEDWALDSYRESVGVGLNWLSPMGPLKIVWGYNLDPLDDEDNSVWDFSVGGTF